MRRFITELAIIFATFAVLTLVLVASTANGADLYGNSGGDMRHWTKLTVAEEVTFQALNVVDWGTSRDIIHRWNARHWDCTHQIGYDVPPATCTMKIYSEVGSFGAIGRHPTYASLNAWIAGYAVVHFAISQLLLNHPYAEQIWQLVEIGDKSQAIANNFSLGLHVRF